MVADSWGNIANGAPARQTTWSGGNNQQGSLNSLGSARYQIVNWTANASTNNEWTITVA
jgi:alpha-L-fucosidase